MGLSALIGDAPRGDAALENRGGVRELPGGIAGMLTEPSGRRAGDLHYRRHVTVRERLEATGIRRLGSKERGFRYVRANGRPATPSEVLRIRLLKIPPAWRDVRIHPSPHGSVQAMGMDAAGRWQYLYHHAREARREREAAARAPSRARGS